ncbi:MAG: apolipoprotein N-acyltransferase [Candidatus Omnitrophica bacterium]|nr:apolipoprotein N-acyltransferase [Candidatus Omnitrophota bacterium]
MKREDVILKYKNFSGSVLSAVLLVLAFPRTDLWPLAWVGLIPLLSSLDHQKLSSAFARAYGCGFLFFAGTLYWFIHVTVVGAVLLIAFLSLYFGIFGLAYHWISRRETAWKAFGIAAAWTVIEFIRAHFLSGFGWVSLGHSQYKNMVLIQIADITGVYGVSFLVVLANVFFKETAGAVARREFGLLAPGVVAFFIFLSAAGYGSWRLSILDKAGSPADEVSVAVIQANTPQQLKWDETAWPGIMEQYKALTARAAGEKPDLIIWPETSYPGILPPLARLAEGGWEDREVFDGLRDFIARLGVPVLIGSVLREGKDYYNAAMLLSKDGDVVETYRKIHLVPFGEYIPLRGLFPFLSQIVPIADFTAGREYTVFPSPAAFSTLVCFEDTVDGISRGFVRRGARFLVNITNDAWFHDTKAPFLHLQAAVFRAVENRRALVRAANTGVSGFIDPSGRLVKAVEDTRGKKTYVAGYALARVPLGAGETFYTKYGDVFVAGCCGWLLWAAVRRRTINP